ncbi:MAG: type 1 glutamine amidotransferase [Planctomycetaceae bacterium]|nr:type 1 glutamine amidotransferase [Planctomycetaceae bacterium]
MLQGEIMIATSYLQNYPQIKQIFKHLGHKVINLSSIKQIDKIAFERVILLGGPDLNPALYGEKAKYPHLSRANGQRDQIDWYLCHTAFERRIPIFGICRGMQLVNVACQGTLWQDLKRDGIGEVNHKDYHKIMVKGPLMNKVPLTVNSRHHQAVNCVGIGLEPIAFAEDGVIEAIWRPGVLGVQWHPEDLVLEDRRWLKLFKWFIEGLKEL